MSTVTSALAAPLPLTEALRGFELFRDLTEDQLAWFVEHARDEWFEEGRQLVHEGDEAVDLSFIMEGEIRFQSSIPGSPVMVARAGIATGLLPFSRLQRYTGSAYALKRVRAARVHRDYFREMLERIPVLGPRLVAVMSDRIRENTRLIEQREKLKALGKLAAGLAHELNNPASAAQRSSDDLRSWVALLRDSNQALAASGFTVTQYQCLLDFEHEMIHLAQKPVAIESMERSDREESLTAWLVQHEVSRAFEFGPVFIDAGVSRADLNEVVECFSAELRGSAISRLAAALAIERLTVGIQASTQRISDLVRAVKGYTYVDQAPNQEIDIRDGLEDTLSMFNHRFKNGITVIRDYEQDLPRINAKAPELNQVWTNLIDNALDAMGGHGTLRIRAGCEPEMVIAEITDTGTGIAPDIAERVFDPFFTTKDVGAGRGLGLDLVFRVVQNHRGDIRFTSQPGETVFQVRLPVQNIGAF